MGITREAIEQYAADFNTTWDYSSRISRDRKYATLTNPKAGCSTIKVVLHALEGGEPVEWWQLHDGDQGMSFSRWDLDELVAFLNTPEHLTFCFVRNPYDRLLSAWKSKVLSNSDRHYAPFRERLREELGYPDDTAVSFREFAHYVMRKEDPIWDDGHWGLQTRNLWWGCMQYDFVGRFESFEADLVELLARLGADKEVIAHASIRYNSTETIPLAAAYDAELAAAVYEFWREDFDAFNYADDGWRSPLAGLEA